MIGRARPAFPLLALCAAVLLSGCPENNANTNPAGVGGAGAVPETGDATGDPDPDGGPDSLMRFKDVTGGAGVEFTYRNGEEAGHFSILESLGGGAALFDADGDDDLDVFLPGGGAFGPGEEVLGLDCALFQNLGDWRFRDATGGARAARSTHYSHGAAAADYDNDGFTDVLVTGYGGLLLLRNQGDGTFVPFADGAGLNDTLWSSSAAWGDVNGDGNLDLYVAHYVNWSFENHPACSGPQGQPEVCPPREFDPLPDHLYISNGDGTFRESSGPAGLAPSGPNAGKGLGVFIADVDNDGDADVYVGNDTVSNFLYRNRGDATFEDVSLISGTSLSDRGLPDGSMGVDLGDYNLDGLPDIWVVNYEHESFALYRNEGDCNFRPVSQSMGVTSVGGAYVGWGTVFADFDLDGDEDIFTSNGHVIRHPTQSPLFQTPLLFQNESGRRLVNVAGAAGEYLRTPHMGRGAAAGDIDNDGDVDLVVMHTNEPVSLLENTRLSSGRHVQLKLIGRHGNRDAIGARVRLETADGAQVRQIKGGASYASTSDRRVVFGLGDQTAVEGITIHWPGGADQDLNETATDTSWILVEGMDRLPAN